ncbi:hypothetical protein protein [Bacillus cereus G9241]|nr:hypothetical protein protein [Bacillus cereus G9241]
MMMRIAKKVNGRAIKSLELMEIIVLKYFNKSVFQWFSLQMNQMLLAIKASTNGKLAEILMKPSTIGTDRAPSGPIDRPE